MCDKKECPYLLPHTDSEPALPQREPVMQSPAPAGASRSRDLSSKRSDYISWDDYFMSVAFLSAMRSKDPCSQVGACIVSPDKKIVGIGYNGMPLGCSDDEFPWGKESKDPLETKYMYVCHAEMNAILNKIVGELRGCSIYVALFPCNECAKLIIQSGISSVIYYSNKNSDKPHYWASVRMFESAGVEFRQYKPTQTKITIDFSAIDWNNMSQMPPSPQK